MVSGAGLICLQAVVVLHTGLKPKHGYLGASQYYMANVASGWSGATLLGLLCAHCCCSQCFKATIESTTSSMKCDVPGNSNLRSAAAVSVSELSSGLQFAKFQQKAVGIAVTGPTVHSRHCDRGIGIDIHLTCA
jgi:hypothetical protein